MQRVAATPPKLPGEAVGVVLSLASSVGGIEVHGALLVYPHMNRFAKKRRNPFSLDGNCAKAIHMAFFGQENADLFVLCHSGAGRHPENQATGHPLKTHSQPAFSNSRLIQA